MCISPCLHFSPILTVPNKIFLCAHSCAVLSHFFPRSFQCAVFFYCLNVHNKTQNKKKKKYDKNILFLVPLILLEIDERYNTFAEQQRKLTKKKKKTYMKLFLIFNNTTATQNGGREWWAQVNWLNSSSSSNNNKK